MIIGKSSNETETPLKPDGFSRIHQAAIPVYTCIHTSVYLIKAIFHPERHNIVYKIILIGSGPTSQIFRNIHLYIVFNDWLFIFFFKIYCNGQKSESPPVPLS